MVSEEEAYLRREERIANATAYRIQRIDELTALSQRVKAAVQLASNGTISTDVALEGIKQDIKDVGTTVSAQLITLYKRMSDITAPECAAVCKLPHSCCSPEYCEATIEDAAHKWGTTLVRTDHPTLPLMGPDGCTAAPHLRPLCTFHTCEINGAGFKRNDPGDVWTTEYFKVREQIEALEFQAYLDREEGCVSKS